MRSLKLRIQKKHIFMALLVLTYALRAFTDAVYVSQGRSSLWVSVKYVTLFLAIFYGMLYLLQRGGRWQGLYILEAVSITVASIVLISAARMFYVGVFSTASLAAAFHLFFPAVVAVLALSIGDPEDIYHCFAWILCLCFAIYCIFEIGLDMFTADQFKEISFQDSYSPFESHYTSGTAMALCAYFSYFRKNKFLTALSLLFSLLVFKRMLVLCSIVLFVLPILMDTGRKLSKVIPSLCAAVFCLFTIVYFWCLIPENQDLAANVLGIESIYNLTSSRSGFFSEVYSSPFFVNFGWGSCEAHLGRIIEMDLIQILIELSAVGLAIFSFSYWHLTGSTLYGVVYMGFNFLNMLTSHSIQNGFIWSIVLITFACIQADSDQKESDRPARRRIVIKGFRRKHA